MNKLKTGGLALAFFISVLTFAQKTNFYTDKNAEFKKGIELFQKEKFGAAQNCFKKTIETTFDKNSLIRIDAEYYFAICAIELFNKDGEISLKEFIQNHPESPKVKSANFYLGTYNYSKKKYKEAIDWFEKVDIYDLSLDELSEFYFKRGYSNFEVKKITEAKKDFNEIKEVDNKYAAAARYYCAHIAYTEKNYETALNDFIKLKTNATFGSVVPYYIAQVFYLQNRYDSVITYAPSLLDSANTKRAPEIARILGESYYRLSQYKEAVPYLKKYEKSSTAFNRRDNYELGYAYYKTKDFENAITYFVHATDISDDSLSQNTYYHLADCYLKINNKQNARNAFSEASKLDFDKSIQEDALFNYAKLSFDLAFNPYNDAIRAYQKYINNYPNSSRIDEAYTYLVNVFITTRSYSDALEAIEKIKELTPELKQAHQKVAYYRGVDLFNNLEYQEAILLFDKSMLYSFDKKITASAVYWKAESFYRDKQYQKAIEQYQAYIAEPGSISKVQLYDANYNIGYAYHKLADYKNSILWFRKYVNFKPEAQEIKINDAYNRIGDGYFMSRDFANAAEYYEKSYKIKKIDADYALFQLALSKGVQKKFGDKILHLQTFINDYGKTTYIQKAKFELAQTYLSNNENDLALVAFKKFIVEYSTSAYVNTCLSKTGLIYYNKKEDDSALVYFDKLIKRDRKSPEANEALGVVKKIYTSKADVSGMSTYLSSVGEEIPQASLDSICYGIGRNHYMEQDCKNVIVDFNQYIQKFPDGIFSIQANFYRAQCEDKLGNTDEALTGYQFVISKNKNEFTEKSLCRTSEIMFDKKNYIQALDYFEELEQLSESPKINLIAKTGLMRCNYQLRNFQTAIEYSYKVLSIDNINNELTNEAHYIIAQSQLALDKFDDAIAQFQSIVNTSKNELGAESFYLIAYINYLKKDYKKSEKTIFEFLKGDGEFPIWVTKSLILLADNYVALNDNFQAKTTLKSIISDSDTPELIKIAQEKLDAIVAKEETEKEKKLTPLEPIKIQFQGDTTEQNKLFNDTLVTPIGEENKYD